jgi:hypothetical protein
MPLLIFHSRTKLFLAIIQQRTQLGGAPTLRLQVQPMNLTLISHHAFQLTFSIIFDLKKIVKKSQPKVKKKSKIIKKLKKV